MTTLNIKPYTVPIGYSSIGIIATDQWQEASISFDLVNATDSIMLRIEVSYDNENSWQQKAALDFDAGQPEVSILVTLGHIEDVTHVRATIETPTTFDTSGGKLKVK